MGIFDKSNYIVNTGITQNLWPRHCLWRYLAPILNLFTPLSVSAE